MNFKKYKKIVCFCILVVLTGPMTAHSAEKIKVLATFSILGDMVKRIGGKHVAITTLVGPDGDTHVYRPTPAAALAMSEAELLIVNGLGFEGWLDRLVETSDFKGKRLVATKGVNAIRYEEGEGHDDHAKDKHDDHGKDKHDDHAHHDHGEFDPHAWKSLENALVYVNNITTALAKISPDKAAVFSRNRAAYVAEIEALDKQIRKMVLGLPKNRRTVVTSHDAFQYFGRTYGLTFLAPQGMSIESEASAKDVAHLIKYMRANKISAVFVENISDHRLIKQIARETGATVGGELYPGALSGPNGPAPTYLKMIHHNATMLTRALGS